MILEVSTNLFQEPPKSNEYVSIEQRRKALENSELPKMLANFLFLVDGEIYSKLLDLVNLIMELSKNSRKYSK